MTNKKMTKRDYFNAILSKYPLTDAEKAFVEHELELLEKKNSSEKKPTAVQMTNEVIKDAIYNAMQENRLYTITELIKEVPECADLTNQRVSALVRQMRECDEPTIERVEEKRKAYFRKIVK